MSVFSFGCRCNALRIFFAIGFDDFAVRLKCTITALPLASVSENLNCKVLVHMGILYYHKGL